MSVVRGRQEDNLVYTASAMYRIAEAIAKERGPIGVKMDDGVHLGYAMKGEELKKLFVQHGYSLRRSTWINNIRDWAVIYDAFVPKDIETSMRQNWSVIFTLLTPDEERELDWISEEQHYPRYPPKKVAE